MPAAELHFYDADDPNGSTIFECSTDDAFVKSIELDIQRDSLGSGKVTFARKVGVGLFTRQIVVPEVLVRVLIPSVHPTKYFYGFWINPRQQQVISKDEQGGEGFTFAGPGPKHYLERMILWSASFTGIDNAVDKEAGIWRWPETAVAGRILDRLLSEDQANPSGPFLPDLHQSFDDTDDSDGNPWTEDVSDSEGSFILRISDDYLKLLWTIEDVSGLTSQIYLGEVGDPVIRLDAFQSFGRDLTGPIGADTVHFTEGVNISTDLDVEGSSYRKASHALVRGDEGVYNLAFKPSWSPGDLKKVVGTSYDSSSGAVLDRAGERFLMRQDNGEEQIDLKIVTGFDPESGLYMPGPDYIGSTGHFWVGDSISLTTGQSSPTALDYQDDTEIVTGIELELEEAVRDDTDEQAARSFAVTVHLNEERKSNHTARDLAGNRGTVPAPPNVLQLCKPSTFTDPVPAAFIGALGSACSNSSVDVTTAYPPWGSDGEERVEITSAEDVPVGGTILVGVSTNEDGPIVSMDRAVYDEKGNEYTLDAESLWQGTSDYVSQVWRSVLTTAIETGDYIRFATRDPGTDDTGGRCIAAAAWDAALSSPTVGTKAKGFTATPTVADSPAKAVTFMAVVAGDLEGVTGDADWNNLSAYAFVAGSGTNSSGLLTEYLMPGAGDAYTATIDQTRDWSVVSVGYDAGGIEGGGSVNDGNADLVGTSKRAARCDHRHDVHRDTAPTVDDDFATAGYKLGTIWAQLDDLDAPTEIVAIFLMVDETEGAAVWLEWPGGSDAVVSLEDLSDVTISAPQQDDDLRYNGSEWVNDPRKWEAVTDGVDTFVWEGSDLVHAWNTMSIAGRVLQVVTASSVANDTTVSLTLVASSLSATITPQFSNSKLLVRVMGEGTASTGGVSQAERYQWVAIYNTTDAVTLVEEVRGHTLIAASTASTSAFNAIALEGVYTVNSTTARTFQLQHRTPDADVTSAIRGDRTGGVWMVIMEVAV